MMWREMAGEMPGGSGIPVRWGRGSPARVRPGRSGGRLAGLLGVLGVVTLVWVMFGHRYGLTLVVGSSMMPTYHAGTLLLVDHRAYDEREPRRDEVVIVRLGREWLVKRVVGLPGEEVEVVNGRLRIEGRAWPERHAVRGGELEIGKGRLGPGKFAVLGDNRSQEPYQMVHAVVPREDFVGRVVCP